MKKMKDLDFADLEIAFLQRDIVNILGREHQTSDLQLSHSINLRQEELALENLVLADTNLLLDY
jgi:hypothetical protein